MTKSIIIEPEKAFAKDTIHLRDIPVNAYQKSPEQELASYTPTEFLAIWEDMCAIRQFETILNEIKIKGVFQGITYNHAGPAHLSIGQEAAAVGMAFSLTPDDHIYGSHRSHGEILAKGFSAIRKLSEAQLLEIMKSYRDGAILGPVEKSFKGSVKDLALRFFVYGAYSEIFARETGFNRGLGGSMHAFFTPFGIYPNNAIVGGSGSIAPGAALFKRVNRKPGIVVCNIVRLRPGLGRHHVFRDGSVPQTVESVGGRRTAHHFQLHEQFLRHGRADARRDHGRAIHRAHRRRGKSGADAR
jgi:2-oxoisovalerate dehydrogenase E1 component